MVSSNKREELIKLNTDYRFSGNDNLILFYFGFDHVHKKDIWEVITDDGGEYWHSSSPFSSNNSLSIVGVPLKCQIINYINRVILNFNLMMQSNPDDLFRIGEINSTHYSWFSLSNPACLSNRIRAKYIDSNSEVVAPLKDQYDAFIIILEGSYFGSCNNAST